MWLTVFCTILVACGLGCAQRQPEPAPDAPISIEATIEGNGQAGILVVTVLIGAEGKHGKVDLTLPDGVRLVAGNRETDSDFEVGRAKTFRYGLKAARPGTYVINVKVVAGEEYYRFGKNVTLAWIAQQDI